MEKPRNGVLEPFAGVASSAAHGAETAKLREATTPSNPAHENHANHPSGRTGAAIEEGGSTAAAAFAVADVPASSDFPAYSQLESCACAPTSTTNCTCGSSTEFTAEAVHDHIIARTDSPTQCPEGGVEEVVLASVVVSVEEIRRSTSLGSTNTTTAALGASSRSTRTRAFPTAVSATAGIPGSTSIGYSRQSSSCLSPSDSEHPSGPAPAPAPASASGPGPGPGPGSAPGSVSGFASDSSSGSGSISGPDAASGSGPTLPRQLEPRSFQPPSQSLPQAPLSRSVAGVPAVETAPSTYGRRLEEAEMPARRFSDSLDDSGADSGVDSTGGSGADRNLNKSDHGAGVDDAAPRADSLASAVRSRSATSPTPQVGASGDATDQADGGTASGKPSGQGSQAREGSVHSDDGAPKKRSSWFGRLFRRPKSAVSEYRKLSSKLKKYENTLRKEVEILNSRVAQHPVELAAAKSDGLGKIRTVYSWGVPEMIPLFEDRAVLSVRRVYASQALDTAAMDVLNARLQECCALQEVTSTLAAKCAEAGDLDTEMPVNLPAGDDFFVDPLKLAGMDKAVTFAKSEILRLDTVARTLDAEIRRNQPLLERRNVEDTRSKLLELLKEEFEAEKHNEDEGELVLLAMAEASLGEGGAPSALWSSFSSDPSPSRRGRRGSVLSDSFPVPCTPPRSRIGTADSGGLSRAGTATATASNPGSLYSADTPRTPFSTPGGRSSSSSLCSSPSAREGTASLAYGGAGASGSRSPGGGKRVTLPLAAPDPLSSFIKSAEDAALFQRLQLRLQRRDTRQRTFNALCTDQRTRIGRLLQRWCSRVLGGSRRSYMFGVHVDLDAIQPLQLRQSSTSLPGAALHASTSSVFGSVKAEAGGVAPSPVRRGSAVSSPASPSGRPGVGKATAKPGSSQRRKLRDRKAARRKASHAKGSGSSSAPGEDAAKHSMVPTPIVILAFLNFFAKTVSEALQTDNVPKPTLRRFIDRLVYPRIYELCFSRLHGHDVMARRDARWHSRVRAARAMSALSIGVPSHFLQMVVDDTDDMGEDPVDASTRDPAGPTAPPTRRPMTIAEAEEHLFASARQLLAAMEHQTIPAKMLAYLVAAMQSALDELGSRSGDPAAGAKLDAESMMPVVVFMISRSTLKRPHACVAYLANFAISPANMGGRAAYLVTTFQAAISWVCQLELPATTKRRPRTRPRAGSSSITATTVDSVSRRHSFFSDEESDGSGSYSPPASDVDDAEPQPSPVSSSDSVTRTAPDLPSSLSASASGETGQVVLPRSSVPSVEGEPVAGVSPRGRAHVQKTMNIDSGISALLRQRTRSRFFLPSELGEVEADASGTESGDRPAPTMTTPVKAGSNESSSPADSGRHHSPTTGSGADVVSRVGGAGAGAGGAHVGADGHSAPSTPTPASHPTGHAEWGSSFEDESLDASVVEETLVDDYMREEGMPEDNDRARDASQVQQLGEWLGQVMLLEDALDILG